MASGFRASSGADLDSVFAARVAAAIGGVGYRTSDGVDISQRYQPGSSGIVTGLRRSDGVDLGNLFSSSAPAPVNFGGAAFNQPPGTGTGSTGVTVNPNGDISFAQGSSTGHTAWYSPLTAGAGAAYDVHFANSGGAGAGASWSGSFGVWQDLTTSKSFSLAVTMGGGSTQRGSTGSVVVTIRRKSDGVAVCSGTITVQATSGGTPP